MTNEYVVKGKPWWLSKGVWGPIITIASLAGSAAGSAVDAGLILQHGLELMTVVGAALGWWGRVEAREPIDTTQVLPGVTLHKKPGPFGH